MGTGNRLTQINGYTFEYDADGNVTRKYKVDSNGTLVDAPENIQVYWNSLNRIDSLYAEGPKGYAYMEYDGFGRRVRKHGSTSSTEYVYIYDGDDFFMILNEQGGIRQEFAHYPGIDRPHSVRTGDGKIYYYLTDDPGNVIGTVNSANQVVDRVRYTPFGKFESQTIYVNPLAYMGWIIDEAYTYYGRNRWYDPDLQRFMSEDPIGLAGGINPYTFIGNSPMDGRDPSGLCPNGGSLIAVAPVNGSLPGLGISCNKPGGSSNTSANFLSSDRGYTGLSFGDALSAGVGFIPGVGDAYDLVSAGIGYDVLAGQSLSATERGLYAAAAFLPVSGGSLRAVGKLSDAKAALREVHGLVGKQPKGLPGKFGSPQRGTSRLGYRLDPGHPGRSVGDPEAEPHINWWDYTAGKRGSGGGSGAVSHSSPIGGGTVESFKIENHQRDHPGDQFPCVEPLSEPKTQDLRARIRMHLGLGPGADELSLVRKIAQAATHLNGVDAQAGDFDLSELLKRLNIRAMPRAYVNWYRFDRVDALRLNDLSDHFDYIWYPGADDIDIFDDSCAWIVSVSHAGDVSLLVLDPGI